MCIDHQLCREFRDHVDGSSMIQYRIQMLEAAVEEGSIQDRSPMNLADLRLQLERYRSRWDNFDSVIPGTIAIPPVKIQICEKGYLVYAFQTDSNTALRVRVIRLPSTCNGVTRGEWVFNLEMWSPGFVVMGMTLQPELDLLVVIVSSDEYMYVLAFKLAAIGLSFLGSRMSQVHTLQLSDGQPHPAIPTPEPIREKPESEYFAIQPCVTRSRLAFLVLIPEPPDTCTFRVYELRTGQVILVWSIKSPLHLTF